MELMEIIGSSITVFVLGLGGFLMISYAIYKLRNKDVAKPYDAIAKEQKPEVIKTVKAPVNRVAPNISPVSPVYMQRRPNHAPVYIPAEKPASPDVLNYYSKNINQEMHKVRYTVHNSFAN